MLFFTGDISLTDGYFNVGFGIGSRVKNQFDPFKHLKKDKEDLWIGNFEGVASSLSINKGFKGKVFRVEPDVLTTLNHLDLYGLANNHAMQHGDDAYRQTIIAIESCGSKCFGSNIQKTIIVEHQGHTISFTAMSLRIDEFSDNPLYWHNPEYNEIEKEISSIQKGTFKVLFIHWGNEFINRPSVQQKKFAHWLIDAGFDLIIGMHPHVLQGYENYRGKYIFYSLGNFVFDMGWEPAKIGAIVSVGFKEGRSIVSYQYIKIKDCAPIIVDESEIPNEWRFENLNEALKRDDNSEQYHSEIMRGYKLYRKANHRYIFGNIIKHPCIGFLLVKDFLKRKFVNN